MPSSLIDCTKTVWHKTNGCLDCPKRLPDNCPKHCLKTAGLFFSGWQLTLIGMSYENKKRSASKNW